MHGRQSGRPQHLSYKCNGAKSVVFELPSLTVAEWNAWLGEGRREVVNPILWCIPRMASTQATNGWLVALINAVL
jgi:hypothetical protein